MQYFFKMLTVHVDRIYDKLKFESINF